MDLESIINLKYTPHNKEEIYIFGSGEAGKIVFRGLKELGISVEGFLDNDIKKQGTKICGLTVFSAGQVKESAKARQHKLNIIITPVSNTIQQEIRNQLALEWTDVEYRIDGTDSGIKREEEETSIILRADQYCVEEGLFIKHNGDVFPCCRIWASQELKIGSIMEGDISEKVKNFEGLCQCDNYCLKSTKEKDMLSIYHVNVEFSLFCQGNCAPCCVGAPWTDENMQYLFFQNLKKFLKERQVKILTVQGGEVFVQVNTLKFLKELKESVKDLSIRIITNGNFDLSRTEEFKSLFDWVNFSFMGFAPDTYECIMGLEREKTLNFIEAVRNSYKGKMRISFVVLPSNVHEICSFLMYALDIGANVLIADGSVFKYISPDITWDSYWIKLMERSGKKFKALLAEKREALADMNINIEILSSLRSVYGIDNQFLIENKLEKIVHII